MENAKEYVKAYVERAKAAQAVYADFTQHQYDLAARAIGKCIYDNAELLAKEAVEETHMGTVDGKTVKQKNAVAQQWLYMHDRVSKGVVGWEQGKLDVDCILKIAKPAGVIAGIMPVTNPTTTMGVNAMQCLKGGNAIIVCPHPRAKFISLHCAELLRDAIAAVGAPKDLIQCVDEPDIDVSAEAMAQCDLVVATGGPGMVKAANSSGNPSFGVGQGNCQVVVDRGMRDKFDEMTKNITANRAYDSGIPCTGEQTIIVPEEDAQALLDSFERNGATVVTDPVAIQKLRDFIFIPDTKNGGIRSNPEAVGRNVQEVGKVIGVDVPDGKLSLVVPIDKFGKDEPLCKEKMLPVTSFYTYKGDWKEAVNVAKTNLLMEGAGHSTDIYTNDKDNQLYAGLEIPVCRMPVNSGQNLVNGRPFYTGGMVSTSGIGCGFWQKNMLGTNLTFEHLLNYTRLLYRVDTDRPEPTPDEIWEMIR